MIIIRYIAILFFIPVCGFAQNSEITINECEVDTIEYRNDKLSKYFIVDNEEIKRLWKFNAVDWGMLNPSIAIEQRIIKSTSVEIEAKLETSRIDGSFTSEYFNLNGDIKLKGILSADYRFYFNKNKREAKGKNTNGFSGTYVFGTTAGTYTNMPITNYAPYEEKRTNDFGAYIAGGIGIQRRVGNIGYIDIKTGIKNEYYKSYSLDLQGNLVSHGLTSHPSIWIDLNLGFAFKSLKRPLFK